MLQWLPVALAMAKPGNKFGDLLNKIHQLIYSLHQA